MQKTLWEMMTSPFDSDEELEDIVLLEGWGVKSPSSRALSYFYFNLSYSTMQEFIYNSDLSIFSTEV